MKLTLQHRDIRSTDLVDKLIEERIIALQPQLQIDEANVCLEHRGEASPPFRVAVHLVTPGPDVMAEGEDHTLRAAIEKVLKQLSAKIISRGAKRMQKVRSNLSAPATNARGLR